MADIQVLLTPDERDLLLSLLQAELEAASPEMHHDLFSPGHRQEIKAEEQLLRGLLVKLAPLPT
jgi:hypothetical protein